MVRQWLTESMLWAVPGGLAGVLLSLWTTDALMGFVPKAITNIVPQAHADMRVLGFALAATLLTGILVGLVPAWRASRTDLNSTLKESGAAGTGRHGRRMHGVFVVVQAAACTVLLIVAGLLLRSVRRGHFGRIEWAFGLARSAGDASLALAAASADAYDIGFRLRVRRVGGGHGCHRTTGAHRYG